MGIEEFGVKKTGVYAAHVCISAPRASKEQDGIAPDG
jgi:hypothetical protein